MILIVVFNSTDDLLFCFVFSGRSDSWVYHVVIGRHKKKKQKPLTINNSPDKITSSRPTVRCIPPAIRDQPLSLRDACLPHNTNGTPVILHQIINYYQVCIYLHVSAQGPTVHACLHLQKKKKEKKMLTLGRRCYHSGPIEQSTPLLCAPLACDCCW